MSPFTIIAKHRLIQASKESLEVLARLCKRDPQNATLRELYHEEEQHLDRLEGIH